MHKSIVVDGLDRGGPYAHAVLAGDTIYISGQTGLNANNLHDFKSQFKVAMEKISKIAGSVGKTIGDIVKLNVYLVDSSYFKEMNELFGEYFREMPPARTTLIASFASEGILVELDATLH